MTNRKRLPDERKSLTHKFTIKSKEGSQKGYLTVGFYDDDSVGEIFVKMDRQGSQVSGFVDAFAILFSMLLQSGTSLETLCHKFRGFSFEPAGATDHEAIHFAKSPIDYIARYLEMKFVDQEIAEDLPPNWAESIPVVLAALEECG